jgi:hypothetical protein
MPAWFCENGSLDRFERAGCGGSTAINARIGAGRTADPLTLLGSDDVYTGELLFQFLARAARTLVLAFFEFTERERERELLFTIQALEFVNRHATSN